MKTNRALFTVSVSALSLLCFNTLKAQTAAKPAFIVNSPEHATEMTFDAQLITDAQAGKFVLAVENPESLNVNITVESSAGIAYESQLNSLSFRKRFDLSDKKDGEYIVTVNTGRRIYRYTVSIITNEKSERRLTIK
jgi:hypothetical protein